VKLLSGAFFGALPDRPDGYDLAHQKKPVHPF
jgi:hypothetical protein